MAGDTYVFPPIYGLAFCVTRHSARLMPVLSSFISYRPKRKKAQQVPVQVSSPFQTNDNNSLSAYGGSLHPYASPRVLDINNGPRAYYNTANTPRVQLNMELDPESLTDWFPTGFLNSAGAEGSGSYGVRRVEEEKKKVEEEEEEEEESADDVLADLEAMDASNFVGTAAWNNSKRPAPSPIKIPNTKTKTASVISSPDSTLSSGVSGTTLARALMANTFVLSPDSMLRQSRGSSMLTRVDSATLPRSEYSPYYRDRGLSMEFSAPPVPDNAELVYVAPQTTRRRPPDAPPSDASSSTPTSPKDLDNVLDYYSFADDVVNPQSAFSTSPDQQRFRLPFSPITEESSSQLSPPTPFNRRASIASRGSSKSAGRFFLGTTPGPSTGGG
ncbi:hypothetical protein C0991_000409 [Blastosporella zonata]|nr:hypothetical protein C0991_000409 [Blastosporella zonata]